MMDPTRTPPNDGGGYAWSQNPAGNPAGGAPQQEISEEAYVKMQQQQHQQHLLLQQQQQQLAGLQQMDQHQALAHAQQWPQAAAAQNNSQFNISGLPLYSSMTSGLSHMIPGMQMQGASYPGQQQANALTMNQQGLGMLGGGQGQSASAPQPGAAEGYANLSALSDVAAADNLQQRYQKMMLQQLLLQQAQQDSSPLLQQSYGAGDPNLQFSSFASLGGGQNFMNRNPMMQGDGLAGYGGLADRDTVDLMPPAPPPVATKGRRKNAKNKRDKNRPKQPLSAYNIFFKDERQKMLVEAQVAKEEAAAAAAASDAEESKEGDSKDKDASKEDNDEDDKDKKPKEEEAKEEGSSSRKRPREAPHGKIGFERMAKTIAKRWKEIEKEDLSKFESRAQEDQKRYKSELAVYLQKKRDETNAEKDGARHGTTKKEY